MASAFCVDRAVRVHDLCNADGAIIDISETVHIFCIVVVCTIKCTVKPADIDVITFTEMKEGFAESLELPMVLFARDTSISALGHYDYKRTMWIEVHSALADLNFNIVNILIETATSGKIGRLWIEKSTSGRCDIRNRSIV